MKKMSQGVKKIARARKRYFVKSYPPTPPGKNLEYVPASNDTMRALFSSTTIQCSLFSTRNKRINFRLSNHFFLFPLEKIISILNYQLHTFFYWCSFRGDVKKKWYFWVVPTTKWRPPPLVKVPVFLWENFLLLRIP